MKTQCQELSYQVASYGYYSSGHKHLEGLKRTHAYLMHSHSAIYENVLFVLKRQKEGLVNRHAVMAKMPAAVNLCLSRYSMYDFNAIKSLNVYIIKGQLTKG